MKILPTLPQVQGSAPCRDHKGVLLAVPSEETITWELAPTSQDKLCLSQDSHSGGALNSHQVLIRQLEIQPPNQLCFAQEIGPRERGKCNFNKRAGTPCRRARPPNNFSTLLEGFPTRNATWKKGINCYVPTKLRLWKIEGENARTKRSLRLLERTTSSSNPANQFQEEPFNAEPPRLSLISSYVTPVDFFYKRNHGPVPIVDDIESSYRVCIGGLVEKPIELSMANIKKLPKYNVTATLQCAGNRRTAMSKGRAVKGVGWDISAIGNAIWGGAKLADVLELVGIPKLTKTSPLGGKHVEFVSVDMCKEEKGGPYKASIPLIQSTNSEADVLLAYEMNEEVPALVFSCKGTTRCFLLQLTGKILTGPLESLKWIFQSSAICSLEDDNTVQQGKVKVHGYAVSGGGRGIERLDVSFDGGKAWVEASRHQKSGIPYNAIADDDIYCDKWAWVLFEAEGDVLHNTEIVAKAVDTAANVQPENVAVIWNLRGILNTSWHWIQIHVKDK
ncbi:unnamed protein product [Camellia sinensis]